mmetsp:Transcript_99890/g.223872  ORF Transcript_99890/g.223872 Transcript_99890/m.223872 type:complete len:130 (-) Transcript_99890:132-521(-)
MGNRLAQSWNRATSCCNGDGDTGTLVIKGDGRSSTRRRYAGPEEGSSRREFTAVDEEIDPGPDSLVDVIDQPTAAQPVGVNTFDKLTHIHGQIQQHLAEQEMLIHKLLQEGDALDAAFGIEKDDVKESL